MNTFQSGFTPPRPDAAEGSVTSADPLLSASLFPAVCEVARRHPNTRVGPLLRRLEADRQRAEMDFALRAAAIDLRLPDMAAFIGAIVERNLKLEQV